MFKINSKKECPFCGDAPVNHTFSYITSIISRFIDSTFKKLTSIVPKRLVKIIESFIDFLPHLLLRIGIIKLSQDKEKAITLRSRVVWDEAERRGIPMEQVVLYNFYTDNYRTKIDGEYHFFSSLPIPSQYMKSEQYWDDKFYLKSVLLKNDISVPLCGKVPSKEKERKEFFEKFNKPLILKPLVGSRGRHTTVNINTWEEFENAFRVAREISYDVIAEEYLNGYVCRATLVEGKLAGFYRAGAPYIVGDGHKSIKELIEEKNKNRNEKIKEIIIGEEINDFLRRLRLSPDDVLEKNRKINLTHRTGRYFGGETKEMLDELHPSFIPVLERAGNIIDLPIAGLDLIVEDPTIDQKDQRWGIIECNTLPFIDLHYFALEGKPKNIAGMLWDLWKK